MVHCTSKLVVLYSRTLESGLPTTRDLETPYGLPLKSMAENTGHLNSEVCVNKPGELS
jgi:hypothetical protein